MADLTEDMLMGLPEFRKLLHLSPSGERRMRSEQQDWPPHMAVGRRVFYFRDGVRNFLALRLGVQMGVQPEVGAAADPGAAGLAAQSPPFTAEQMKWLQAGVIHPPGYADDPFRPVDLDETGERGVGHE